MLVLTGVAGCGDEDNPAFSQEVKQQDGLLQQQPPGEGRAPRQRRQVLRSRCACCNADGTLNVNFIDGPNYDGDIVHTGADGTSGKKLAWDLDQDGNI